MQNKSSISNKPAFKITLSNKSNRKKIKSCANKVANNFKKYMENKNAFLDSCDIDVSLVEDNYILKEYKFFNDKRIRDIEENHSITDFISLLIDYNKMPETYIKLQKIESDGPNVKSPVVVNVVLAGNVVVAVEYAAIFAVAYALGSPEKDSLMLENKMINFNVKSLRYNTQYFKVIQLAQILYGEAFAKEIDNFIYQKHLEFPKSVMQARFNIKKKFDELTME